MLRSGKIAPATLRRAFFVFTALFPASVLIAAQAPKPPDLAQVGLPSAEEAAKLVKQVREAGIPGSYYLEFELRSLPRRGQGKTFRGQLWSGHNDSGEIVRVELADEAGASHRLLLQRGDRGAVWRLSEGRAAPVEGAAILAPLIPGVEVTAFDLQMPFLTWPDVTVEKLTRVLGRPTNAFLFRPPPTLAGTLGQISGVRAYLDTQFNAILQTEALDEKNRPVKTFAFVSLKRVGEQTVPKELDFKNETTHDKTRLQVTGVALNLTLPPTIFQPANLARPAQPPAPAQLVRIEP